MPIYEYQCENCGDVFEVMQKFSDEPLATHQKCGGKVHRLISAPAFQFKGSGWYITDYAKSSNTSEKTAENGSSKKGEGKPAKESSSSESGSATPSTTTGASSESKSSS